MDKKPGNNTFNEIMSQPDIWRETCKEFKKQKGDLDTFWEKLSFDQVLFTGCGSTYYLSITAASLFQLLTGIPATARPASELALFPNLVFPMHNKTLLVAISRSGKTTETIEAIPVFREYTNGKVLSITCDSKSELAKASDFTLSVDAAQEASIAQTRSFSSMAILAEALAGHIVGLDVLTPLSKLPNKLETIFKKYHPLMKEIGENQNIDQFFFLGAGSLYGIASEAMLKMKEMSLSNSEVFHPLEFRHGPMSMVSNKSLVVGLLSETANKQELAVLQQMENLGGNVFAIAETAHSNLFTPDSFVELQSDVPEWARTILYLPPLQLMAFYRALSKGQDPDNPHNLNAVVELGSLL
jgi:glucosamine--fructose-6-phosphate aminotransferase (isomerizing)